MKGYRYEQLAKERIGEVSTATNGMKMTLVAYRGRMDIDVLFEDGSLAQHIKYLHFRDGTVRHPSGILHNRLGETIRSRCGMLMTIIAYRSSRDIDVQFEDGTIVEHREYQAFKLQKIAHPSLDSTLYNAKERYLNKEFVSSKGIKYTVIAYRSCFDLDIEFETGYKVTITDASCLTRVHMNKHPFPYDMGAITIYRAAYIHNNVGNFYCKCTKCGHTDIMTIPEMKTHKCNI